MGYTVSAENSAYLEFQGIRYPQYSWNRDDEKSLNENDSYVRKVSLVKGIVSQTFYEAKGLALIVEIIRIQGKIT